MRDTPIYFEVTNSSPLMLVGKNVYKYMFVPSQFFYFHRFLWVAIAVHFIMPASQQIPFSWVRLFLGSQLSVKCQLNDFKYIKNVSSKKIISFVSNYAKFNSNGVFLVSFS